MSNHPTEAEWKRMTSLPYRRPQGFVLTKPVQQPASLPLPSISIIAQAATLGRALVRWHRAGYKLASRSVRGLRKDTCLSCVLSDGQPGFVQQARGGLGKCRACGCTSLKWWLQSERCPLRKWPA